MASLNRQSFKVAWIVLTVIGIAILLFGLIVTLSPGPISPGYVRASGVAAFGMGLFGSVLTLTAFRRRERWAWGALWYYPIYWAMHWFGNLPPGKDHIHQIVFIVLSVAALLFSWHDFFSKNQGKNSQTKA